MKFPPVFQNLWERFGPSPAESATAPPPGLEETQKRLEQALDQLNQRVVVYKKSHDIAAVKEFTAEELEAREAAAVKANADALRAAIMPLHEKLETGLTGSRIEVVVARMKAMAEQDRIPRSMPERLAGAVRKRAIEETGKLAWLALEQAMKRHDVAWPEPGGLGHAPTPERIEQVRKMETARMRSAFLGARPAETADLAQGLVRVWKTVYPEPSSGLWTATALQGVGAGLWCFYAGAAQAIFYEHRMAIEKKANEVLSDGLSRLSDALAHSAEIDPGVQSNVMFRAQEIVADVIPSMVWAEIGPRVEILRPGVETDALLAEEPRLLARS
jgi:hypothetical protein